MLFVALDRVKNHEEIVGNAVFWRESDLKSAEYLTSASAVQ